jgi:hypothetical protein
VPHLRHSLCACSFKDSFGARYLQPTSAITNFADPAGARVQHQGAKDTRNHIIYNSEFYCPSIPRLPHDPSEHEAFRDKVIANHALEAPILPGNPELLRNQLQSCGKIAVQEPHTVDSSAVEAATDEGTASPALYTPSGFTAWATKSSRPTSQRHRSDAASGPGRRPTSQSNSGAHGPPRESSSFTAAQGIKPLKDRPGFYPSPYTLALPTIGEGHKSGSAGKYPDATPTGVRPKTFSVFVPGAQPGDPDVHSSSHATPVPSAPVLHDGTQFGVVRVDDEAHRHPEMNAGPARSQYPPSAQPHNKPFAGGGAGVSQYPAPQPGPTRDRLPFPKASPRPAPGLYGVPYGRPSPVSFDSTSPANGTGAGTAQKYPFATPGCASHYPPVQPPQAGGLYPPV